MEIRLIKHYGKDYWKCVRLRDKILREPINLMFSEEELFLENEQIHVGCFESEIAVGCFSLVIVDSKTLKMRQVCVDNNAQGKGVGNQMMKFAENWATENKYTMIECNARETAVAFYHKHGYQKHGEAFMEVDLPHYKMKKSL